MEINVSNMPINTLYRFDNAKYIYKTKLMESRGGKYVQSTPFDVTEVYEITNEGYIRLVISGELKVNEENSQEFEICDYDTGETLSFRAPMLLQETRFKDFWETRDFVGINYRKTNR